MEDFQGLRALLSPTEALFRGLLLLGYTEARLKRVRRKRNLARFRSHYGSDPLVYTVLLTRLQTTDIKGARVDDHIDKVGVTKFIAYFFMAIHLLCCYPTENEAEGVFSKSVGCCEKTWSFWSWTIIENIYALKPEVIVWPEFWYNPDSGCLDEPIFIFTVDGVHCRIEEPTHADFSENTKFYSHKFKQAAVDYEVVISVHEQKCVFINGPFEAGKPDITIFRHSLKKKLLKARETMGVQYRGIADRGYKGEPGLLSVPNSLDDKEVAKFKARALTRHETFNGRLKNFDCLEEMFRNRHGLVKHRMCFTACCVIVQLQMENGSPLFQV